jgi:hypothetical protein
MPIGDIRFTVLEIVQEVCRKLSLNTPSSLTANKETILMVDYINDICDELSDYGNWQEMMVSANVTAVSGQENYSITTSANIKNIADIYFSQRKGPLRSITVEDMRLLTRVTAVGQPTQFTVFQTDANGNPNIRVRPTPSTNEAGGLFSVLYYIRCPQYTTSDASTVVPFPGQVVVNGVLALCLLGESDGAQTDRYVRVQQMYQDSIKEAINRFNGDTGWSVSFTPSSMTRRRR